MFGFLEDISNIMQKEEFKKYALSVEEQVIKGEITEEQGKKMLEAWMRINTDYFEE